MNSATAVNAGRVALERNREYKMRTIVAVILIAAGLAVSGAATGAAGPIEGATLARAANADSLLSPIGYYRWHGRLCYSKCYREFIIGRRVCRRFC